jgi:hypothetical protein
LFDKRGEIKYYVFTAVVAQLVEHSIGNGEVMGSIPVNGSRDVNNSLQAPIGGVDYQYREYDLSLGGRLLQAKLLRSVA